MRDPNSAERIVIDTPRPRRADFPDGMAGAKVSTAGGGQQRPAWQHW